MRPYCALSTLSVCIILACSGRVPLGAWASSGDAQSGGDGSGGAQAGAASDAGAAGEGGAAADPPYRACHDAGGATTLSTPRGTSTTLTIPYVDWTWPSTLESLEWDLEIETESVEDGFFWAHKFNFGNVSSFMGLQDRGRYVPDPREPSFVTTKMVLFAVASAPTRTELGDVTDPDDAHAVLDPGTQWWTIHVRYDWVPCRMYHLRVALEGSEAGDNWYGAWITDSETQLTTYLGRMLLPGSWGSIGMNTSTWSNRIGWSALSSCRSSETASAFFGTPSGNGGSVRPLASDAHFGEASCALSSYTTFSNGVRQVLNAPRP